MDQNAQIVEALKDMQTRMERERAASPAAPTPTGEEQPGKSPSSQDRPTQQYGLPTPVRSPVSYNPQGTRPDILGHMRQVSLRSQANRDPSRPGSAVTPFRAGR